jgi:hypothetical protein
MLNEIEHNKMAVVMRDDEHTILTLFEYNTSCSPTKYAATALPS